MNYIFKKRRRNDFRKYFLSLQPNWMMTVNYKRRLSGPLEERERVLLTALKHWTVRILTSLYGRKFAKHNIDDAFLFVAFIQTGCSLGKEHLHLLVRVPQKLWIPFRMLAKKSWATTDDVRVELICNLVEAVNYESRDLICEPDRIVFSNQFRKLTS